MALNSVNVQNKHSKHSPLITGTVCCHIIISSMIKILITLYNIAILFKCTSADPGIC